MGATPPDERDEAQLKAQVQAQFGASAAHYVTSKVHATGLSLDRLVELTQPQSNWRTLDVATGGGHTALAFAPHVRDVVALDLTTGILQAARNHSRQKNINTIRFVQGEAGWLPFADESFELATCRIAPHHFPDVGQFMREMARVVRPGGQVAIADNAAPKDRAAAEYINAFERLRDASHNWAFNMHEWLTFFSDAGLSVLHHETQLRAMDFENWVGRMTVTEENRMRLRVMLLQAPAAAREWLAPQQNGAQIEMTFAEVVIIGQQPKK